MGGTPKEIEKDWGLGGVLITQDSPDGKKAGTMLWGGLPNLIWVRSCFREHILSHVEEANYYTVGRSKSWHLRTICGTSPSNWRCEVCSAEQKV